MIFSYIIILHIKLFFIFDIMIEICVSTHVALHI